MKDINIIDLAHEPKDKQENYLEKIAHWYFSEWGKYRPDIPNLLDWRITELIPNQLPITLIAVDIAENPSKLVGVARLKYDDVEGIFPNEKKYRLSGFYIDAAYRRKGIGAQLIKQILHIAENKEAKELWLFTHSEQAKNFYLKLGWLHKYDRELYGASAAILCADVRLLLQKLAVNFLCVVN